MMPPVNLGYAQVNMYRDGGTVLEKPEIASLEKLLAQTPQEEFGGGGGGKGGNIGGGRGGGGGGGDGGGG